MAFTKATYDYLDAGGLINWQLTAKTSAFTAVSGEGYLVDTSSAAITVTLPASPSAGDEIIIVDYASNAGTNNITLGRNSLNIRGATDDLVLSTNNQTARLLYSGATKGWLVTTEAGAGAAAASTPALTVDYLVVAGGGGSARYSSAGAGAGGLRTSYGSTSGGGASAESAKTFSVGTNYTITVGAGGAGESSSNSVAGGNGSASSITGSDITNVGTAGGGGGGRYSVNGLLGGSGGGIGQLAGGGTPGAGTTSEGFAGGPLIDNNLASGGGGASQVGNTNGNAIGGDGVSVNILSSTNATTSSVGQVISTDVFYAGGGGGATLAVAPAVGSAGGNGGGGHGGSRVTPSQATNGTPNTGGGAGGGQFNANGMNGGSGVVILRYPDAYTITRGSGLTEASGSPFTEGSDKVSVFTDGTGTITFS